MIHWTRSPAARNDCAGLRATSSVPSSAAETATAFDDPFAMTTIAALSRRAGGVIVIRHWEISGT